MDGWHFVCGPRIIENIAGEKEGGRRIHFIHEMEWK
jgi:hypothetical protein